MAVGHYGVLHTSITNDFMENLLITLVRKIKLKRCSFCENFMSTKAFT